MFQSTPTVFGIIIAQFSTGSFFYFEDAFDIILIIFYHNYNENLFNMCSVNNFSPANINATHRFHIEIVKNVSTHYTFFPKLLDVDKFTNQ